MLLPFFSKKIHMTIKPLKIASQTIFIDRQINLNTRNFKIIAYNQKNYKNKHGALFLRFSIFWRLYLITTYPRSGT